VQRPNNSFLLERILCQIYRAEIAYSEITWPFNPLSFLTNVHLHLIRPIIYPSIMSEWQLLDSTEDLNHVAACYLKNLLFMLSYILHSFLVLEAKCRLKWPWSIDGQKQWMTCQVHRTSYSFFVFVRPNLSHKTAIGPVSFKYKTNLSRCIDWSSYDIHMNRFAKVREKDQLQIQIMCALRTKVLVSNWTIHLILDIVQKQFQFQTGVLVWKGVVGVIYVNRQPKLQIQIYFKF
jgi:hypothetical protein